MGFGKVLRERFSFIRFLVNAQKTIWYPVLFALLCIISGLNDHTVYVPILWIFTAFILFSVFFADDNKVFLTPLLMIFCSLGIDTDKHSFTDSNGELLSFYDPDAFKSIMTVCVICVSALLIRLVCDGSIKRAFTRRRFFTFSIILTDAAFLLNGAFSPQYEPINIFYGALMALGLTVVYFLVSGMLDDSEDPVTYACYSMVATAYVALAQIMYVVLELIKTDSFFKVLPSGATIVNRDDLVLGWGISTVIAAVFVLGIPAAMYLAKDKKACILSYLSAILFAIGAVFVNTRSAVIVGFISLLFCMILCCITGKNRVCNRIFTALLVMSAITAAVIFCLQLESPEEFFDRIMVVFRLKGNSDSGRITLWQNGIQDFKASPIFGVGFNNGAYDEALRHNNLFSNMYHCLLIQIPASMGLFGVICFTVHFACLAYLCFKNISVIRVLLLSVALMILAMSLVDNFFFYFNFQIYYCVFLVCAETSFRAENPIRQK